MKPLARIITHSTNSQEPKWFTTAPIGAIEKVPDRANWNKNDVDLFEVNEAFAVVGIEEWSKYVKQDPRYMRPAEVDVLRGDYTKAKEELGWEPKTDFKTLVTKMVKSDIKTLSESE